MPADLRLLLISGSLRSRSTNTAVLRTAVAVAPDGIEAVLYEQLGRLPHFNPDDDAEPLPAAVADLRRQIHLCEAVMFSTPEYAGALPGSFKNLLDWTVGDDQAGAIHDKPVAWINASPRGAVNAHDSLRKVLGYTQAHIVEPACVDLPVTGAMVGQDGLIADDSARDGIRRAILALASGTRP